MAETPELKPVPAIDGTEAYRVPRHGAPVDLWLAGNEGRAPSPDVLRALEEQSPELLRRYPSTAALEARLAQALGVDPTWVVVTAGADDALDRTCRAMLAPGREMILPVPTFEMLDRYATLTGADVIRLPWPEGAYPTEAVIERVTERTRVIAVVTPNNPTGAVATADDVKALAEAAPHAMILVDGAYAEFADDALTEVTLSLPNALMTRTLSKAYGVAGLRVGYAVGQRAEWLRRTGNPYAVSSVSLALADKRLDDTEGMARYVAEVRRERDLMREQLHRLGVPTPASQGNFIFVRHARSGWLCDGLAGLGIAVRGWPGHPALGDAMRITVPGVVAQFERLRHAIEATLKPRALLFDMDGVLADVSASYRQAIVETAASYGVELSLDDIAQAKRGAGVNNDWELTQRLLKDRGVETNFEEVKARFEALYQGDGDEPGLYEKETLLCSRELLSRLKARMPLGIVTGRPRHDAERFLKQADIGGLFDVVVCMEDAALKPDPAPVALALKQLGATHAWMVGDTPDDIVAARGAGVVPLGINADARTLTAAGAARVLKTLDEMEEML